MVLATWVPSLVPPSQTAPTSRLLCRPLETSVEDISAVDTAVVDAGDNVNRLVGATSAGTTPVDGNGDDNYLFLVVNKANGAIVAMDKTFIEAEG